MAFLFRKRKTRRGFFTPHNPKKYIGATKPRFMSSYELAFFRFCDANPNVIKWGSESVTVPYVNPIDKKVHLYIVDNFVLLKDKQGEIQRYLVEIKPLSQTKVPTRKTKKQSKRLLYEQLMYAENTSKWEAAKAFCAKTNMKFLILTEYDLGLKHH